METAQDKTHWDAYLLDMNLVLKIREKGVFLRQMKHEDIAKLKAWGPVEVVGNDSYAARRAFYTVLESQDWFKGPQGGFTTVLPAIYVRNKVDYRVKLGVGLNDFLKSARKNNK